MEHAFPDLVLFLLLLLPFSKEKKIAEFTVGTQPATVVCKIKAQLEYAHLACTFLPRFGADLYAQLVLINKISALELRRKCIKSALSVGLCFFFVSFPFLPVSFFSLLSSCFPSPPPRGWIWKERESPSKLKVAPSLSLSLSLFLHVLMRKEELGLSQEEAAVCTE